MTAAEPPTGDGSEPSDYDRDLSDSTAAERRVLWKELGALAVVGVVIAVRQLWLR